MKSYFKNLVTVWLFVVCIVGGGWRAEGALVSFAFTNSFGSPDTNYFTVTPIEDYINNDGGFITKGRPLRLTPKADGRITNSFLVGNYAITNRSVGSAFLIRVPNDSSSNVWNATDGEGNGGLAISGYNKFVTVSFATNGVATNLVNDSGLPGVISGDNIGTNFALGLSTYGALTNNYTAPVTFSNVVSAESIIVGGTSYIGPDAAVNLALGGLAITDGVASFGSMATVDSGTGDITTEGNITTTDGAFSGNGSGLTNVTAQNLSTDLTNYVTGLIGSLNRHFYFANVTNTFATPTLTNNTGNSNLVMWDMPVAAAATNSISVDGYGDGAYFVTRISTNTITRVESGPIELETYVYVSAGAGPSPSVRAHPEIYLLFPDNTTQEIASAPPLTYANTTVQRVNISMSVANSTNCPAGTRVVLRWKLDAGETGNSTTWHFVIGGDYDSHITLNTGSMTVSGGGSDPNALTNNYTAPVIISNSLTASNFYGEGLYAQGWQLYSNNTLGVQLTMASNTSLWLNQGTTTDGASIWFNPNHTGTEPELQITSSSSISINPGYGGATRQDRRIHLGSSSPYLDWIDVQWDHRPRTPGAVGHSKPFNFVTGVYDGDETDTVRYPGMIGYSDQTNKWGLRFYRDHGWTTTGVTNWDFSTWDWGGEMRDDGWTFYGNSTNTGNFTIGTNLIVGNTFTVAPNSVNVLTNLYIPNAGNEIVSNGKLRLTNSVVGSARITIGPNSPVGNHALDVQSGMYEDILVGAQLNSTSRSNNQAKYFGMAIVPYADVGNSAKPLLMWANTFSGGTYLGIGGGSATRAYPTQIKFWASTNSDYAANITNSSGVPVGREMMRLSGIADPYDSSLSGGGLGLSASNVPAGSTGTWTINRIAGSVNFAAGSSSLVVSNFFCKTNSLILGTIQTDDATATLKNIRPAGTNGWFTINLGTTNTAETRVAWLLINPLQ